MKMTCYVTFVTPKLFVVQLKNTRKAQEATLAAVKREAEMKKKKEKEETEKTTGETVETPHKPDKSTSQTADVTEENTSQGEQVVTVVQLHHDAGDTVADSGDTAVDRGDTVVDSGDTVNGSDKVEVKVEPPRMTKLKAKPKSQEVDSAVVVGDADKPKKDETKGDVSEGAKETSDMTEGVGDKEGKQGKEEREGDKETVEEREEVVGDRGDMVGDRGDTAEGVGSKEETVTSVTDDTDVVTSTQVTDVDQPEETGTMSMSPPNQMFFFSNSLYSQLDNLYQLNNGAIEMSCSNALCLF